MSLDQLEIIKTLADNKALQIFDFITSNELVTPAQITTKFGNCSYLLKKLEQKKLIYQVTDPLNNNTLYKPTLRSKQILSAICATMQDIEAA